MTAPGTKPDSVCAPCPGLLRLVLVTLGGQLMLAHFAALDVDAVPVADCLRHMVVDYVEGGGAGRIQDGFLQRANVFRF